VTPFIQLFSKILRSIEFNPSRSRLNVLSSDDGRFDAYLFLLAIPSLKSLFLSGVSLHSCLRKLEWFYADHPVFVLRPVYPRGPAHCIWRRQMGSGVERKD